MLLRQLLECITETVQGIVLAADQRYWEGYELLLAGRSFASIYLWGYVAEMLLKSAALRFDGAQPSELVGPRLGPAKTFGKQHFPLVPCESYHSLLFWANHLTANRSRASCTFTATFLTEFNRKVQRMYDTWLVSMRYHPASSSGYSSSIQPAALDLLEDVVWLRKNHSFLWS